MADDNKPMKYMRYAIGEILLVVIGILLALQINNWNEQRKLNAQEQFILKELLAEFNINLDKLRTDASINVKNQASAIELLDMINTKTLETNEKKIDSLFAALFSFASFNPSTGTLDEIINSGKLNVLKGSTLRKLLTQWKGMIVDQQEDIDIRLHQLNSIVFPILVKLAPFKNADPYMNFSYWSNRYKRKVINPSNLEYDFEGLISKEFEGSLYKYVLDQDFVLLNDAETEAYIISVITELEKHIK